jgi:peptide deformylase
MMSHGKFGKSENQRKFAEEAAIQAGFRPWASGTSRKNEWAPSLEIAGFDVCPKPGYGWLSTPTMIREIVQYGHPILRQRCRPVTEVDDVLIQLVADMLDTMVEANGVGLAAPQVDEDLRLAVIDVSHDPECVSFLKVNGEDADLESIMPLVFINPELAYSKEKELGMEGCLSIRGIRAEVRRPAAVKATLPQLDGSVLVVETDGLLARALQHEIDHLNGVLFVDRLTAVGKVSMKNRLRRLLEENEQS